MGWEGSPSIVQSLGHHGEWLASETCGKTLLRTLSVKQTTEQVHLNMEKDMRATRATPRLLSHVDIWMLLP